MSDHAFADIPPMPRRSLAVQIPDPESEEISAPPPRPIEWIPADDAVCDDDDDSDDEIWDIDISRTSTGGTRYSAPPYCNGGYQDPQVLLLGLRAGANCPPISHSGPQPCTGAIHGSLRFPKGQVSCPSVPDRSAASQFRGNGDDEGEEEWDEDREGEEQSPDAGITASEISARLKLLEVELQILETHRRVAVLRCQREVNGAAETNSCADKTSTSAATTGCASGAADGAAAPAGSRAASVCAASSAGNSGSNSASSSRASSRSESPLRLGRWRRSRRSSSGSSSLAQSSGTGSSGVSTRSGLSSGRRSLDWEGLRGADKEKAAARKSLDIANVASLVEDDEDHESECLEVQSDCEEGLQLSPQFRGCMMRVACRAPRAVIQPHCHAAVAGASRTRLAKPSSSQASHIKSPIYGRPVAASAYLESHAAIVAASPIATSPSSAIRNRRQKRRAVISATAGDGGEGAPAPVPVPAAPVAAPWKGANMKTLGISVATGVAMWYCPRPEGVAANAWQLLAIFLATIIGIITQPLPLGAVALMGLGVSVLTKTLTFAAAFSSFGDPIPWLIALAFFFAKGFINTGLGNRVGYQFVAAFGSTSLGLGYSLVLSEAMLAPAIPSVSARAGGIFLPLLKSLCQACGSRTDDGTEKKLGSWLVLTCFQTSIVSSAMFLTGMAANPLAVNLAAGAIGHTIGWTEWAKAALVPGLISLAVMPALLYVIYPPEIKASPDAPKLAREKLASMGPMSTNEKIMAGVLVGTVGLWVCGGVLGIDAVTAAIMGLSALLITGVVTWKECLGEGVAWDTLTWFAALIAMANYLNKYGLIAWFSQTVVNLVSSMGLAWQPAFGLLVILYFYSHYFFASGAAHIGAMFVAFISVASALGTPPLLAAMVLSFMSNLMGGITHYGIGSGPPFYGSGYVSLNDWWFYGFICSVVNLVIWLGVGGLWWKFLGIW
ncbi:unnamed protein product [Closterium sp. Naga37s-1]|nr:unnamed protein product [Closterium sp. Naga37s-1]